MNFSTAKENRPLGHIPAARFRLQLRKILAFALFFISPSLGADSFFGPLQVKNRFPLFQTLGRQFLEPARPENSLSFVADYSSVFLVQKAGLRSVAMDMELASMEIRYKQRLFSFIELEFALPFLAMGPGILDPLVDFYHKASGLPDAGRSLFPQGRFLYGLYYADANVLYGKPGRFGHGDTNLGLKLLLFKIRSKRALALRIDSELPTGNPYWGYGNGNRDDSLRLIYEERLLSSVKLYANLGLTDPGDIQARKRFATYRYVQGGLGLEWLLDERHSLLVQSLYATSPFPHTRIPEIDREGMLLSLGWRIRGQQKSWEFSFSEDINTAGAPDFTLQAALRFLDPLARN